METEGVASIDRNLQKEVQSMENNIAYPTVPSSSMSVQRTVNPTEEGEAGALVKAVSALNCLNLGSVKFSGADTRKVKLEKLHSEGKPIFARGELRRWGGNSSKKKDSMVEKSSVPHLERLKMLQ